MGARALLLGLLLGFGAGRAHAEDNVRQRLSQIFYWHLSDELKLAPAQEKEMVQVLESVEARRTSALAQRDQALAAFRKRLADKGRELPAPEAEKLLAPYREALATLAKIDEDESARLAKLLGPATLVRFYVVREDVLARVREALKQGH